MTDWNYYFDKGKEYKSPWLDLYSQNIENLYNWNNRLIRAAKQLPNNIVVSHGDLEPKNVMWCNEEPIIIDWEAAGFIHPMHDLVETALYWSVSETEEAQRDKFIAFVKGYKSVAGTIEADWPIILDKGFGGKLGWLEYSLKRSLGMESTDLEEQRMGTEHTRNYQTGEVIGSCGIYPDNPSDTVLDRDTLYT